MGGESSKKRLLLLFFSSPTRYYFVEKEKPHSTTFNIGSLKRVFPSFEVILRGAFRELHVCPLHDDVNV